MSDKSQRLADLLAKVPAPEIPFPALEGKGLLEIAFLCVLQRRLSESAAEKTLTALSSAYPDWNELRVSQVQEFQHLVQTKNPDLAVQVGRDTREFLQEIYQKIHGFSLDSLKGNISEAARFAAHLPFLGTSIGHYLLHLACPDELPVSPAIVRTLDRLGYAKRTSSIKKAQAGIESFVPPAQRRDFAIKLGLVVEKWCDAKKPLCWSCPLVGNCPFGKKVERDHKQSLKRHELQRARQFRVGRAHLSICLAHARPSLKERLKRERHRGLRLPVEGNVCASAQAACVLHPIDEDGIGNRSCRASCTTRRGQPRTRRFDERMLGECL